MQEPHWDGLPHVSMHTEKELDTGTKSHPGGCLWILHRSKDLGKEMKVRTGASGSRL
jgi:hypothetical protein